MKLHGGTFVVLGSDGLWDVLSDADAVITAASALKVNDRGLCQCLVGCYFDGVLIE
jgi:serine/threonine protein phosphatase PrpC